ncbi:hypothetical protein JL720_6551 [Aureococcus anophagefferens]|nr:hypothetical protein JL720_6551 [Aureococcus anophagefferens]
MAAFDALDVETKVLAALGSSATLDSYALSATLGVDHQALLGVVKSLWADGYVTMDQASTSWLCATNEGAGIAKDGSPEYRVYAAVDAAGGRCRSSLGRRRQGAAKIGLGAAMREVAEQGRAPTARPCSPSPRRGRGRGSAALEPFVGADSPGSAPDKLADANVEKQLMRRKLLARHTMKHFAIAKGASYAAARRRRRILRWTCSRRLPQSHPARDAHDTFFVKEPAETVKWPADYYDRPGGFKPAKYFSIDRVFREAMDSTHLCEFHQVEGLIADYDLSLGNLKRRIANIRICGHKADLGRTQAAPICMFP